jgi:hypothetical protein
MEIITALRASEYEIAGFLVPWAMVLWAAAYLLALGISTLLEACGGYRWIWHPPLFFIALTIILGCSLGFLFAP